jgi:hypothetical protein
MEGGDKEMIKEGFYQLFFFFFSFTFASAQSDCTMDDGKGLVDTGKHSMHVPRGVFHARHLCLSGRGLEREQSFSAGKTAGRGALR